MSLEYTGVHNKMASECVLCIFSPCFLGLCLVNRYVTNQRSSRFKSSLPGEGFSDVGVWEKNIEITTISKRTRRWRFLLWTPSHNTNLSQSLLWHIILPESHISFPCLCFHQWWTGWRPRPERSGRECAGDACSCSHSCSNSHIHSQPAVKIVYFQIQQ